MGNGCKILLNSKIEGGAGCSSWRPILPVPGKEKKRSCNTSCALLRVSKGLTSYVFVTEWAARSEGADQRKQLHVQQHVVTSSQVPDGWLLGVSRTQITHQMKLFLLPEQPHLTVTMQVWCKCLSLMIQIYGDTQIPNCCLQNLGESSKIIFQALVLNLLL